MSDSCFQLKGSVVSIIVLELHSFTADVFTKQLQEKIQQAPHFFQDSPIVIHLEKVIEHHDIDLLLLLEVCRHNGLQPMAFRAVPEHLKASAQQTGLVILPASNRNDTQLGTVKPEHSSEPEVVVKTVVQTVVEEKVTHRPSKIISRPVRSGQQIYAENADLVILTSVSEGAEVIADGNIHIYGTLRGRALAGVKGDTDARVFCQNLSAELVSIAGNFALSDRLREQHWQQAVHIQLDGDNLDITAL